jgi:hypothetical protein
MIAIAASADFAGLERYAYRLLCQTAENGHRTGRSAARRAAALDPQRLERNVDAPPAVPLAYQLWLSYLLWLEEALRALGAPPRNFSGVELAGLQALARARTRFLDSHQACPRCHAVSRRSLAVARCRRCGYELSALGAAD